MTYRPTCEILTNDRPIGSIPAGSVLQVAYRPEYGDSVRVVAARVPGSRLYEDMGATLFVPRADLRDYYRKA